jgi:glycerol-3-phosphate cytidylyltransferase-like family protein
LKIISPFGCFFLFCSPYFSSINGPWILGDRDDLYRCITDNKPDVIGLGYDQKADVDELKERFPSVRIVRLKAFEPEINKSSLLRNAP